jgi:hypothetical protein
MLKLFVHLVKDKNPEKVTISDISMYTRNSYLLWTIIIDQEYDDNHEIAKTKNL